MSFRKMDRDDSSCCGISFTAVFLLPLLAASAMAGPPVLLTEWGTYGADQGQFVLPIAVAVDSQKNVYVADINADRVQKFDSTGHYMTSWGVSGIPGGDIDEPLGLAVDSSDRVYVVDGLNGTVQVFDSDGQFLSTWGAASATPGPGEFYWATNIALSTGGRVFVSDQGAPSGAWGHNIQVFDSTGNFQYQWGQFGTGLGELYHPYGVLVDDFDDVYVADSLNHRIQKFDALGNHLTSWGSMGAGEGEFNRPLGMAFDTSAGLVYVIDAFNYRVQAFDRTGKYVAKLSDAESGGAWLPFAAAVDKDGDIYVVDALNSRVQKFGPPRTDFVLDVKPGGGDPKVNLRSNGLLNVGVLSSATFDAGEVDPQSLALGAGAAGIFHATGHTVDLNGDGLLDLMLHFRIPDLGVQCGDVSITMTGELFSGERIEGTDQIITQGC